MSCYPKRELQFSLTLLFYVNLQHVKGVLGFSPFIILDELFDLALGFPPDYMHGVLLGVTKDLLTLWFSAKNKEEDYFIGHLVSSGALTVNWYTSQISPVL